MHHTQQYRINPTETIMCTPSIITLNNKKKVANTNYKITHYTQHIILYEEETNTAAHNEF